MLTIQDYFRWPQPKPNESESLERFSKRYERHRMRESLRLAEDSGFFLNLTPNLLLEWFHTSSTEEKDSESNKEEESFESMNYKMNDLLCVCLSRSRLRQVGAVEFCNNLLIVVLDNNYLTNLEALAMCRLLKKLDVHGNHLEVLPGLGFWSCMKHLQHLYLHNNPIGRTSAVAGLVAAPQLSVLTLFDTPLSLKKNYRHHIINSIWSLKALDRRIVSDGEIIENLSIKIKRFVSDAAELHIQLHRSLPNKTSSMQDHLHSMQKLNREINLILKHHSPVIIIQRYVRGHLTRLQLGVRSRRQDVQQGNNKILSKSQNVSKPTASSKVEKLPETTQQINSVEPLLKINLEQLTHGDSVLQTLDQKAHEMTLASYRWMTQSHRYSERPRMNTPTASPSGQVFITLQSPQITNRQLDLVDNSWSNFPASAEKDEGFQKFLDKLHLPSERQLLSVLESTKQKETEFEVPLGQYRVMGNKQPIEFINHTVDGLWRRTQDGELVREADDTYHRQKLDEDPPKLSEKALYKPKTDDQRRFQRNHGTMSLWLLHKWDSTDEEVAKADRLTHLSQRVQQNQSMRSQMKGAIDLWKSEKQQWAQSTRQKERHQAQRQIETKKQSIVAEHKAAQLKREKEKQLSSFHRQNVKFAQDFRTQQTSVGKALLRHDRQVIREDKLIASSDNVQAIREEQRQHMQTIRDFLEQQRLVRQSEVATQRTAIENHILQETTERLLQAQARVDHLRAIRNMAEHMPASLNTFPENPTLNANSFKNLDNWSAKILVQVGHVGKHPPQ